MPDPLAIVILSEAKDLNPCRKRDSSSPERTPAPQNYVKKRVVKFSKSQIEAIG
jgi:hypothetical protein